MQALAAAYRTNPQLEGQRAELRATDEGVARAKSGYRPRITGSADINYERTNTSPPSIADGKNNPRGYDVTLSQPVFRGFRTVNEVLEAETNVRAGRATLRSVEQSVLLDAVTAYMDVIRDRAIVRLRENNVKVLSRELRATQDRFDVGEVTRTDVAQARARRALAVSQLDLARGNLKSSRAVFERVVGHPPNSLQEPGPIESRLPMTLQSALDIGQNENPNIVAAAFREKAAGHAIDRIRGEFLPEVTAEVNYRRRFDPSRLTDDTEATTVTGRVVVPIYQAGEVSARVRQARRTRESRFMDIEDARVQARSDITSAWSTLEAARAQLDSDRIQVEANRTALAGVREEEKVGQRTLLDVLDAEQELLNSQVSLVGTRRDLVVASYALLAAIGRLSVSELGLSVEIYNNEEYYRLVRSKFWGTTVRRDERYDGYADAVEGTKDY